MSTVEAAETTAAFEKLNEFAIYGLGQHESQYVLEVSRARFIPEDDQTLRCGIGACGGLSTST